RYGAKALYTELLGVPLEWLEASTLREALDIYGRESDIDAVLLDLNLSDCKGLQGLRQFVHEFPQARIAVFSATQDEFVIRQARARIPGVQRRDARELDAEWLNRNSNPCWSRSRPMPPAAPTSSTTRHFRRCCTRQPASPSLSTATRCTRPSRPTGRSFTSTRRNSPHEPAISGSRSGWRGAAHACTAWSAPSMGCAWSRGWSSVTGSTFTRPSMRATTTIRQRGSWR